MLFLMGALGFGVFAAYISKTPQAARVPNELRRDRPTPVVKHEDRTSQPTKDDQGTKPTAETYYIPKVSGETVKLGDAAPEVPAGEDAKKFLGNETLKAFNLGDGPAVLGVDVRDHIAVLDMNQAFVDHGYGSSQEGQLVEAMQIVYGQFPDVEKIQFMCNGQPIDSLGHLELSAPLPVEHSSKGSGPKPPEE